MHKFYLTVGIVFCTISTYAQNPDDKSLARLTELDKYWAEVSKAVETGNFRAYSDLYHEDAVLVMTVGDNKTTMTMGKALQGWQKGFEDTKEGEASAKVEFRLSDRFGSDKTAMEKGIFYYSLTPEDGKPYEVYVHFEALLIKRGDQWIMTMENQKAMAGVEEWNKLEPIK